jgi:hypothetical protein
MSSFNSQRTIFFQKLKFRGREEPDRFWVEMVEFEGRVKLEERVWFWKIRVMWWWKR